MIVELYNSHAVLDTEDDELFSRIRAYLTITDRKFNPVAGHYDSSEIFILPDGTLPIGLLPDALELLEQENIEYTVEDYRTNIARFDKIKLINPEKSFGSMRTHQAEALLTYAERITTNKYRESAIFDHATNAGKSYIIASLVDALEEGYAFILVHDATLYTQLIDFLEKANFSVGRLRGRSVIPGKVIVCMYKSVINRQYEFEPTLMWLANEASLLIVDECHRAGGNEYYMLINTLGVATRLGFSGTPFSARANASKVRVRACFGDIAHTVTTQQLNAAGINAKLSVHLLYHNAPVKQAMNKEYHEVYQDNIIFSPARLDLIVQTVAKHDSSIMITVNELAHMQLIKEAMLYNFPSDEIIALPGGASEDTIRELRKKFSQHYSKRIVLITTIWQEGANIAMDVMIYAQGGASEIELVQYLGRMGRNTTAFKHVYDFYDMGAFCENHSKARIGIYQKYGYEINPAYEVKLGSFEPSMAARFKNLKLF